MRLWKFWHHGLCLGTSFLLGSTRVLEAADVIAFSLSSMCRASHDALAEAASAAAKVLRGCKEVTPKELEEKLRKLEDARSVPH